MSCVYLGPTGCFDFAIQSPGALVVVAVDRGPDAANTLDPVL